jgi:Carboxypeptidase regulatory-like domain
MNIRKMCVLAGAVSLNLSIVVMLAQSTAQISGAVKDQTGAVLPGVEVTMTQADTGLKRTAVTDETGLYNIPSLPVGPYRFEAALPGFRTYIQTGIVLQINSNPIINAVLQVGQVSDEVNVQADTALVETRATGVGSVMDNVRVVELRFKARTPSRMARAAITRRQSPSQVDRELEWNTRWMEARITMCIPAWV